MNKPDGATGVGSRRASDASRIGPSGSTADARAMDAREPQGVLAKNFQEALTVAVRVRAGRQSVPSEAQFRDHVKRLLKSQADTARGEGYGRDDVRLAVYACIAILDENIHNFGRTQFPDWPGKPLQEEVFGSARAGEVFFDHLKEIVSRPDSTDAADLAEVYLLCLLLGYRGKYMDDASDERQAWMSKATRKIDRVRGGSGPLSPRGALPRNETAPRLHDPALKRFVAAAAGAVGFAVVLFLLFTLLLGMGASGVGDAASRIVG